MKRGFYKQRYYLRQKHSKHLKELYLKIKRLKTAVKRAFIIDIVIFKGKSIQNRKGSFDKLFF